MTWWAIDVRPVPERREWLSAWLVARTGQAVEERDDGTLVGFAPDAEAAETLVSEIAAGEAGAEASRRAVEDVDWSVRWREGLGPRRFGRLTVVPSWIEDAAEPGTAMVVLDPENAFGSGEHGSTRAALTLLERLVAPGDMVLDLGSGSGILSVAAVKLGAARAIGIETDPEANEVAARNAARNGVSDRVRLLEGDAADLAGLAGPADLVLSNILRTVNTTLVPVVVSALRPGAAAIFSGMEHVEAPLFLPALEASGLTAVDEVVDTGWWAVAARRP
jgi:ribosomal protein L11 methyltransferase